MARRWNDAYPDRMDLCISVIGVACWLSLHADYITDYLLTCHMLFVKELWTESPYVTKTHYSAHLLNLTLSG